MADKIKLTEEQLEVIYDNAFGVSFITIEEGNGGNVVAKLEGSDERAITVTENGDILT